MIYYETERLVAQTEMILVNGHLTTQKTDNSVIDIMNLEPATGYESAFVYKLKDTNEMVCHIGITWQRNRFEVSYGTESAFRRKGFICEALSSLIQWLLENTNEDVVWGLPNGSESEHILIKSGFTYYGLVENSVNSKWYMCRIKTEEAR